MRENTQFTFYSCVKYIVYKILCWPISFTGNIERSAWSRYFGYSGGFLGFSPRWSDMLHRLGVQGWRCCAPKLKNLTNISVYKRPIGAYPLRDFYQIFIICA